MVDKAAELRALAGVRESEMLGSSSSTPTHEDLHGSPVFDRLNELSTKLNRLMTDLQMIRQEIERRLEEDSRQGGTGAKDHDHRYGATSSGSLTAMTLEGLLERGKGLCEQIKNVIHELEQNQLRAQTPSEKQSCASSLKVAGGAFKASLLDFIDLEGRYRDHIDDRVEDSRRRTLQLDSAGVPDATREDARPPTTSSQPRVVGKATREVTVAPRASPKVVDRGVSPKVSPRTAPKKVLKFRFFGARPPPTSSSRVVGRAREQASPRASPEDRATSPKVLSPRAGPKLSPRASPAVSPPHSPDRANDNEGLPQPDKGAGEQQEEKAAPPPAPVIQPAIMHWLGQRQLQKTPEYRGKRAKLHELDRQHEAMLQFEQQVTELHEIVLYMDAICEAQERDQRDVLETIEQGVDNTLAYAGDGLVKLEEAEVHKESYDTKRRALSWGTLSLLVIGIPALVLLGVLLFVKM